MSKFLTVAAAVSTAALLITGCGSRDAQQRLSGSAVYCDVAACHAVVTADGAAAAGGTLIFGAVSPSGVVMDRRFIGRQSIGLPNATIASHDAEVRAALDERQVDAIRERDPRIAFVLGARDAISPQSASLHHKNWLPAPIKSSLAALADRPAFLWSGEISPLGGAPVGRSFLVESADRCPDCEVRVVFVPREMMVAITADDALKSMAAIDAALAEGSGGVTLGKVSEWMPGFSIGL